MEKHKVIVKCPFCHKKYIDRKSLYNHMELVHKDDLGGISAAQYFFNFRYHKTKGQCIICKKETKWNEELEKYDRLCSEECKIKYRKIFRERMLKKYGKDTLLDDPEQQKKMLANRKISGKYKFSDGIEVSYTGSYELDFLKYLDSILDFNGKDIISPAPQIFDYIDGDVKRFYIPDMYIPILNLIVEIKDGGDNPNNRPNRINIDGRKELIKDDIMRKQLNYNFIKIVNKKYSNFVIMIENIKNENLKSIQENRPPKIFIEI